MNRGNHYLLDIKFKTDLEDRLIHNRMIAKLLYALTISTINSKTDMKIINKHLEILDQDTPLGFTFYLLLDESHCAGHCYYDEGLIALDIFTCGNTDVMMIVEDILEGFAMVVEYEVKYQEFIRRL